MTTKAIARAFGRHPNSCRNVVRQLKRYGIPLRTGQARAELMWKKRPRVAPEKAELALKMIAAGHDLSSVMRAAHIGFYPLKRLIAKPA